MVENLIFSDWVGVSEVAFGEFTGGDVVDICQSQV
jgi:hypothetical protein